MFATQQEADRAVGELNGKIFVNNKGLSGTIIVTHSRLMESRLISRIFIQLIFYLQ